MPQKNLIVIGAGPKGIALAAKAAVLQELAKAGAVDFPPASVPHVTLIDSQGFAANWSGSCGYTDGRQRLGTPPQKDIGFPYSSDCWGDRKANAAVDAAMLAFSWQAFLVASRGHSTRSFSSWVDRGFPAPSHGQWAEYLRWAAEKASADLRVGSVRSIDVANGEWGVKLSGANKDPIRGAGLVITGPGPALHVEGQNSQASNRVFDAGNFWDNLNTLVSTIKRLPKEDRLDVCVIGSGESAAAAVVSLVRALGDRCSIEIIAKFGVIYSRGESYDESRHYSDPRDWVGFRPEHRNEFIDRTDRGVFSIAAKQILNDAEHVRTIVGKVASIAANNESVQVFLEGDDPEDCKEYAYAVVAKGFDSMWWLNGKIFQPNAQIMLKSAIRATGAIEIESISPNIGEHLHVAGVEPRLHLPMLAAKEQGPGFPNLSSLGLLTDRIIKPYCT